MITLLPLLTLQCTDEEELIPGTASGVRDNQYVSMTKGQCKGVGRHAPGAASICRNTSSIFYQLVSDNPGLNYCRWRRLGTLSCEELNTELLATDDLNR